MDLGEIEWQVVDWIRVAQDGEQWRVLVNLRLPYKAENFLTS